MEDGDTVLADELSVYDDDLNGSPNDTNNRDQRRLLTSSEAAAQRHASKQLHYCRVVLFLITLLASIVAATIRFNSIPGNAYEESAASGWFGGGNGLHEKENTKRLRQTLDYLSTNKISGLDEAEDAALWVTNEGTNNYSSQYRAAYWIATLDRRRLAVPPKGDEYPFLQRYALAVLFYSTGGAMDWKFKSGWLSGWHECAWYGEFAIEGAPQGMSFMFGVICDGNPNLEPGTNMGMWDRMRIVTDVSLTPMNNMKGTLPSELHHLRYLKELHVMISPGIKGEIPSQYGSFPNLRVLNLAINSLEGTIPSSLSSLDKLERLELENNYLIGDIHFATNLRNLKELSFAYNPSVTGTIPDSISNLSKLKRLSLSNVGMSGTLPLSMLRLKHLEDLYLDDNKFSGSLDVIQEMYNLTHVYLEDNNFNDTIDEDFFFDMKNLVHVDLSTNNLRGSIPGHFFKFPDLEVLDMSSNHFDGELPAEDMLANANKSKIKFLSLHSNNITGPIPQGIALLKEMTHLDLSLNLFTGDILEELGGLVDLEYLFLGRNNLNGGPIPEWLRNMTSLGELSLKGLSLTGGVPDWLGDLSGLRFLDLGENELSGTLPDGAFGNLTKLWVLILNQNEFNGTIPQSFSDMSNLETLLIDDNNFEGSVNVLCERSDKIKYFIADCASRNVSGDGGLFDPEYPEVLCDCCTLCCNDGNETCNDSEWLGNHEGIWESGYDRWTWEFQAGKIGPLYDN